MAPSVSVLVIGGNGFLGQHVVDAFLSTRWDEAPIEVSVVDLREPQTRKAGVTYHVGDITSADDVRRVLQGVDVVVHTASPVHGLGKAVYFKVNVEGTRNVIDSCKTVGVKALVFTSSAGVVFNGGDLVACDESQPYPAVPMDAYNDSKAVAEQLVLAANAPAQGFKTCALRPAGLFGEADAQMIPGMLSVLANKQTRFQIGDNTNLFDFTYIGNAADAHVLAAHALLYPAATKGSSSGGGSGAREGKVDGEAFFITNGAPIPFWNMPRGIFSLLGHVDSSYIVLPRLAAWPLAAAAEAYGALLGRDVSFTRFRVQFTCANRYYDISKAQTRLGYTPKVSIQEGLRKSLVWFEQNGKLPKGCAIKR